MKEDVRRRMFAQHGKVALALIFLPLFLVGCGARLSSPEQVTRFKKAGPIQTVIDFDLLAKGKPGPYRVIPGDVLIFVIELTRPIKRGICFMHGKAYVGDKVVMEGHLVAQIIKNKEE